MCQSFDPTQTFINNPEVVQKNCRVYFRMSDLCVKPTFHYWTMILQRLRKAMRRRQIWDCSGVIGNKPVQYFHLMGNIQKNASSQKIRDFYMAVTNSDVNVKGSLTVEKVIMILTKPILMKPAMMTLLWLPNSSPPDKGSKMMELPPPLRAQPTPQDTENPLFKEIYNLEAYHTY